MRLKRQEREEAEMRERKLLRQKLALEKAKKAEEQSKQEATSNAERLIPNEGNGCDLPTYKWTQNFESIEISVPFKVDFVLKSRDVIVEFKKQHLKVGLRGWDPVIDGDLFAEIVVNDECSWSLDVNKKIATISMPKVISELQHLVCVLEAKELSVEQACQQ
jgi:hypothetical protein